VFIITVHSNLDQWRATTDNIITQHMMMLVFANIEDCKIDKMKNCMKIQSVVIVPNASQEKFAIVLQLGSTTDDFIFLSASSLCSSESTVPRYFARQSKGDRKSIRMNQVIIVKIHKLCIAVELRKFLTRLIARTSPSSWVVMLGLLPRCRRYQTPVRVSL